MPFCLIACDQTSHQHEFSTKWKTNTTEYWHECECGEKQDLANHKDEDEDELCDVCGYVMDNQQVELNNDYVFTLHQDGDDAYYSVSDKNKYLTTIENIPSYINNIPVKAKDDRVLEKK